MAFNILLVIPRNQFDEDELFPLMEGFKEAGCRVLVLSRTGKEATGINKARFQPDGMLADWNKQEGVDAKYNAVVVTGGKGAPKTLWTDDILPQLLTDHFRAGKIVAAIGLGVGSLAQAALLVGEASVPDHPELLEKLSEIAIAPADEPVTKTDNVITAAGAESAKTLVKTILASL